MTTSTSSQEILLQIRNVNKNFGGLQAIDDVTLDLPAGVITTLVGPNGAGKTTLFNLITGHLNPSSGTIHWLGKPLKGSQPWQVARLGIARTFQDLRLYSQMTVEENIMTVTERGSCLRRTKVFKSCTDHGKRGEALAARRACLRPRPSLF